VAKPLLKERGNCRVGTRLAGRYLAARLAACGLLAALLLPALAEAEFYSFEDKNGAIHFVDDASKIPKEYRKKRQVRKDKYDDLSEQDRSLMLENDRQEREAARSRETEKDQELRKARLDSERLAALERRRNALTTPVIISGLQVFVPVTLCNGSTETEVHLLLDTGATSTVITPEVAARLNIDDSDHVKVQVVGGRVFTARRSVLSQMRVGPAQRSNQPVVIVSQRGGGIGDGLLGMSFLAGLKYTIDFQRQTITWLP
jgi:predicted aspartyl protease